MRLVLCETCVCTGMCVWVCVSNNPSIWMLGHPFLCYFKDTLSHAHKHTPINTHTYRYTHTFPVPINKWWVDLYHHPPTVVPRHKPDPTRPGPVANSLPICLGVSIYIPMEAVSFLSESMQVWCLSLVLFWSFCTSGVMLAPGYHRVQFPLWLTGCWSAACEWKAYKGWSFVFK